MKPIPTLSELGQRFKVADPYKGYTKLLKACFKQAEKKGVKAWINLDEIRLLPEFAQRIKDAEKDWDKLTFEIEPYRNKSPEENRLIPGIIPLTTAQLLVMYTENHPFLPEEDTCWGLDCIAEETAYADVPCLYWGVDYRRLSLSRYCADDRDGFCSAPAAVGLNFKPSPSALPSDLALETRVKALEDKFEKLENSLTGGR